MDIKYFFTLFASLGALVFSLLNYRRSRRFENENHLFKLKIDIYSKIIFELHKLLNELYDSVSLGEKYLINPNEENRNQLHVQADKIDKLCFDFVGFMITNSLIIPNSVVESLHKFCDKAIDSETIDADPKNIRESINMATKIIDELTNDADAISVSLRKDLNIENLNISLYKRLK